MPDEREIRGRTKKAALSNSSLLMADIGIGQHVEV